MKKIILLHCFCIAFVLSKGQTINASHFRLCLDGYSCSDSILKLTKKQLLEAQTLSPNFSWFTITDLTFYFSGAIGTDVFTQGCKGNSFCSLLKPLLERCGPGSIITIVPTGHNRSGKKVDWAGLSIMIKEE